MAREGSTLSPLIRQAWDRGNLSTLTKNSPAKATDAHISIIGHVTKGELLRYLNDIEAGNGFANRFLWGCSKRARVLPEGGGKVNHQKLVPMLYDAIRKAKDIRQVDRTEAAKGEWGVIYEELSDGRPGLFGSITARAEAQVLRLSVLYAVMDGQSEVTVDHLHAALAVWQYCEDSARYIFGDATGDPVADRIAESLRALPEGMARTDIYRLFGNRVKAARVDMALGLLLQLQMAKPFREANQNTIGRPAEIWKAV